MSSRQNAPQYGPDAYPPFSDNPQAACKNHPTIWWFPTTGQQNGETAQAAKRICRRCPILEECREWAIPKPWTNGIWGGMSPHDRAYERRRRAQTKASA